MSDDINPYDPDVPNGEFDASDPNGVRRQKEEQRKLFLRRQTVLQEWLSTEEGRELYAYILHDLCLMYRPVAVPSHNPHALEFNEGARAVGQVLHQMTLAMARPQYMVLLDENLPKP